jgi:hypothetical protein
MNRKVEIYGSEIRLYSPQLRSGTNARARAKEILDSMEAYQSKDKNETKNTDRGLSVLGELAETSIDEAVSALGLIISDIGREGRQTDHGKKLRKLGRIVKEGQNDQAFRKLLAEQMPALSTLISRLNAADKCGGTGDEMAMVNYAGNLTETFPELLKDSRFFSEELGVLLKSGESNTINSTSRFMQQMLEKEPSLVAPMMKILLSDRERPYLQKAQCGLITQAFDKYGWHPDQKQTESLLSILYRPSSCRAQSLFDESCPDYWEFPMAIRLLNQIRKEDPSLVEGLELPGRNGRMTPAGKALMDQIGADSADDEDLMRFTCTRIHSDMGSARWMKDFYQFVFPMKRQL